MLTLDKVYRAHHLIKSVARYTDMIESNGLTDDCDFRLKAETPTIPDLIFNQDLLKESGYFVLEHSKAHNFSTHPHFVEERSYGNVHFTFFQ